MSTISTIPTVTREYLAAAASVISWCQLGIEGARAGTLPTESMRKVVKALKNEAARARSYISLPLQPPAGRRALEALATSCDRLRREARRLL